MFRHHGKKRTKKHNLQIAIVLSFIAGMVNVSGFLAFHQLTTNVTGHFAFFIEDVANFDFWESSRYLVYVFSFLLGSFTSGFLIELFKENKKLNVYLIPTIIESIILFSIGLSYNYLEINVSYFIVCLLLFAMGLQNSFVTKISDAVVRTTHLTGLFTDLGIEISYLFFPSKHQNQFLIRSNIKLRLYIIIFFFTGGIAGGYLFTKLNWGLNTLNLAAVILIASLFYDDMRLRTIKTTRKIQQKRREKHQINNH